MLSVENKILNNYNLFPNPSSDKLNIDLLRPYRNVEIRLVDMLGRVIIQDTYNNTTVVTLDVSSLNGQFILLVNLDGKDQEKRGVIIQ